MQRPEIDMLISLNEEFDKFSSPANKNSEAICGWDDFLNRYPISAQIQLSSKIQTQTPKLSRLSQKNKRNISLAFSVKKDPGHLNLSPLNIKTLNLKKNQEKKTFFPVIRNSLYNYANEKSTKWNNFEVSNDRTKDYMQDKGARLTSATPVVMVRRKNLYY